MFKLALWTSDATLDDVNRRIGMIMKNKLGVDETIRYEVSILIIILLSFFV